MGWRSKTPSEAKGDAMFAGKTNLARSHARARSMATAAGLAALLVAVPAGASAQPSGPPSLPPTVGPLPGPSGLPAGPPAGLPAVPQYAGPPATVGPIALGLNTAPWDYEYAAPVSQGGGEDVIQTLLPAAGIDLMRYGGGSYADYYDWQTNTDIQSCIFDSFTPPASSWPYDTTAPFTGAACDGHDSLSFDQFSAQAKAVGAQSFVTVNYGSGTPALAAAWAAHAQSTPGDSVALWDVGNENYGCWEVNNWLSGYPEYFQGYKPNDYVNGVNATCPQTVQGDATGTQTLATSYAVNARPFMLAMKEADPSAQIGVPWAFGNGVGGAAVPDNSEWNDTVLGQDGDLVSFVDAHYYPFSFYGSTGGTNPSDHQVLQALMSVPALYEQIKSTLATYDPKAQVVVGETNVSNNETTTVCTPAGALFAAGDVLSWLAAGAESVDWWDMNNYGNTGSTCTSPDYGMFSSGAPPFAETPYYGYVLASILAKPGARLRSLATSDPADVMAWQSRLPRGGEAVALLNTNTSASETVTFGPVPPLVGQLETWSYSAGVQNSTDSEVVKGTTSATSLAKGLTLPPESLVVLEASH